MSERKWIKFEQAEPSFSAYEVSKRVVHLLRHSQQVPREDDGAILENQECSSKPISTNPLFVG